MRADIIALLRERRYEETLAALYRARADAPSDLELQRSIDQLKEFLVGTYAKRLGGLDRVAAPIPLSAVRTPDAVLLARYIDGTSTYGDLAQMCPLGQLRTLQVLIGLYGDGEPPRIYGMEQPGSLGSEASARMEAPTSGLRLPEGPLPHDVPPSAGAESDQRAPDTARSSAVAAVASAVRSDEERQYAELFARGTAAFVQGRFADAAEAFEGCLRLRPDDRGAAVMLRRVSGDGRGGR